MGGDEPELVEGCETCGRLLAAAEGARLPIIESCSSMRAGWQRLLDEVRLREGARDVTSHDLKERVKGRVDVRRQRSIRRTI